MPDNLRSQLEKIADRNGRSLNNEIVARLEAGLFSVDSSELPTAEVAAAAIGQRKVNKANIAYSIAMKEIAKGISEAVDHGQRHIEINIRELDAEILTDELPELKNESIGEKILNKLSDAGYEVELAISKEIGLRVSISF